ncbi:MAG: hypothetical protein IKS48_01065 [Eubacterium sp.]|nr:hypothetical protein [Eubacterium sp.]
MIKNHNFRFNLDRDADRSAWEVLHSERVEQDFKSQNQFVVKAINDYSERHMKEVTDPFLSSREKEEAFIDRILETVQERLFSNLPEIMGRYLLLSLPRQDCDNGKSSMNPLRASTDEDYLGAHGKKSERSSNEEPEENELLDFNMF